MTKAVEELLYGIYAHTEPVAVSEIMLRDKIARSALQGWLDHAGSLIDPALHEDEYERLNELQADLSNAVLAKKDGPLRATRM